MIEQTATHAGHVVRCRLLESGPAVGGEHGEDDAAIVSGRLPSDEALTDEAVETPGQTAR